MTFLRLDKLGLFLVLKKKVDSGKLRLRVSVASFLREREGKKRVACGSKSRIISNDLAFQILEKLRLASQRSGHQPMGSHQSYVAVLVPD